LNFDAQDHQLLDKTLTSQSRPAPRSSTVNCQDGAMSRAPKSDPAARCILLILDTTYYITKTKSPIQSLLFQAKSVPMATKFCKSGSTTLSSWWFQPLGKYESKWESSPNRGENKNI